MHAYLRRLIPDNSIILDMFVVVYGLSLCALRPADIEERAKATKPVKSPFEPIWIHRHEPIGTSNCRAIRGNAGETRG